MQLEKQRDSNLTRKQEDHHSQNREVFSQLQQVLLDYLETQPSHISLYAISKKCSVSEPTLRRIKKGQIKSLPSTTTIIGLLSFISKEKEIAKLVDLYPGPLATYLKSRVSQIQPIKKLEYSEELSQSLKDPVRYILYKLAANECGITRDKAIRLFGLYGEKQISHLIKEELLEPCSDSKGAVYRAKIKNFALSNDVFVDHFKTLADFIKIEKHANADPRYAPICSNYSSSINKNAYNKLLKIQRATQRKMMNILSDEKSKGNIPTFVINAIDTIDEKIADEFED